MSRETDKMVVSESPVMDIIAELSNEIKTAHDRIQRLNKKLQQILLPPSPTQTEEAKSEQQAKSPIESVLGEEVNRVFIINRELDSILARLRI